VIPDIRTMRLLRSSLSRKIVVSLALAVIAGAVLAIGAAPIGAAPGGRSHAPLAPPGQQPLTGSRAQESPRNLTTLAATVTTAAAPAPAPGSPLKMKLLVVTADGQTGAAQTDLSAIKTMLGQLGIPYDVFVASGD